MSKELSPMEQAMKDAGWYQSGTCWCNGIFKQKFRKTDKPGIKIKIAKSRNKWTSYVNEKAKAAGKADDLKNYLSTL